MRNTDDPETDYFEFTAETEQLALAELAETISIARMSEVLR